MLTFLRAVLRLLQVISKLFALRAFAALPMTRKREKEIRSFMAADPPIWGHTRRAKR